MFGRRITLFRLFGFAVRLDASWIIIAALVIWSLASAVFPRTSPGLPHRDYFLMGIAGMLGLFGSIVLHELCHSLVARRFNLPMNGITLFIFGGVAEMGGEPRSPEVEFWMALAGPVASIVIGAVFHLIHASGHWSAGVMGVIGYLAWINWILAAFNMIPAFPLDGGRVLRAALWHFKRNLITATEWSSRIGSGFGFLLMAFAAYSLFSGNIVSAVWYFLIGTFLRTASRMSYEQLLVKSELEGEAVRRFMRPTPLVVKPETSLLQLIEDYVYRYDLKVYPVVTDSQQLLGCVSTRDIKEIPREEWARHQVSEIVKPCPEENTVGPETDAMQALTKIQKTGDRGLLVTEHNRLLAVVSLKDVLNFLAAKMELEGRSGMLPRLSRLQPLH